MQHLVSGAFLHSTLKKTGCDVHDAWSSSLLFGKLKHSCDSTTKYFWYLFSLSHTAHFLSCVSFSLLCCVLCVPSFFPLVFCSPRSFLLMLLFHLHLLGECVENTARERTVWKHNRCRGWFINTKGFSLFGWCMLLPDWSRTMGGMLCAKAKATQHAGQLVRGKVWERRLWQHDECPG